MGLLNWLFLAIVVVGLVILVITFGPQILRLIQTIIRLWNNPNQAEAKMFRIMTLMFAFVLILLLIYIIVTIVAPESPTPLIPTDVPTTYPDIESYPSPSI